MNPRIRFAFTTLTLLAVLVGIPVLLTWRAVRQERLDRALIAAIKQADRQSVVSLLRQGADPNTRDSPPDTRSLRHRLVDLWRGRRFLPLSSPTALLVALGDFGSYYAPDPMLIKALLEAGADPNMPDNQYRTPLMLALEYNDTVHLLLEKGANINARDEDGDSALLLAEQLGNRDKVRLLVKRGADVNIKNKVGYTPLTMAIEGEDVDSVRLLIARGADVNVQNDDYDNGATPLMEAVKHDSTDIVAILLKGHADINANDNFGYTASQMARQLKNRDVANLLKQAGAKE